MKLPSLAMETKGTRFKIKATIEPYMVIMMTWSLHFNWNPNQVGIVTTKQEKETSLWELLRPANVSDCKKAIMYPLWLNQSIKLKPIELTRQKYNKNLLSSPAKTKHSHNSYLFYLALQPIAIKYRHKIWN